MAEKCWRCGGEGKVRNLQTLSPSDDEECPICCASGEAETAITITPLRNKKERSAAAEFMKSLVR